MADRCVSRRFSKNWQSLALIGGLGAQVNPGPRSVEVPEASIWCLTRDHEAARDHFPGPAASPMSNEQLSGQVGRMSQVSHHASQAGAWLKRMERYGPMIRRVLREHSLPEDLQTVVVRVVAWLQHGD